MIIYKDIIVLMCCDSTKSHPYGPNIDIKVLDQKLMKCFRGGLKISRHTMYRHTAYF